MDDASFDRVARLLAAAVSRRAGIRAALAAIPALAADDPGGILASRRRRAHRRDQDRNRERGNGGGRGKGPSLEGPCGNGSVKANRCSRNEHCCTGSCDKRLKTRDGKGRCRCIQRGEDCKPSQTCCGGHVCINEVCSRPGNPDVPAVPTGQPCDPAGIPCANPGASCTAYAYDSPAGTYCLLPRAAACSANDDCASRDCDGGVCILCSSPLCGSPCTPVVCPSCANTTIQEAIDDATAGDVVAIAAGTYTEDLAIAKNLTLRACPGGAVTITNTEYDRRAITVTDGASLTLIDIIVDGYSDQQNTSSGGGISTDGNLTLIRRSAVRNGFWNLGGGISAVGDGLTVTITDQTTISGNIAGRGGGVYVAGASSLVVSGDAILEENETDSYGGAIAANLGANVTISGHVIIRDNVGGGAGLYVRRGTATRDISVVLEGDVLATGNTATVGAYGPRDGGFARFSNNGDSATYRQMDVQIRDRVAIIDNSSTLDGGAISTRWAKVTISGSVTIADNHSTYHGGAFWTAPVANNRYPAGVIALTITDHVLMTGNSSDSDGGAIELRGASGLISGSALIEDNTARYGGGVNLYYSSGSTSAAATLTVEAGASITGNTALGNSDGNFGGGVYSDDGRNSLTAAAGTITANTPDNCDGAGISCP